MPCGMTVRRFVDPAKRVVKIDTPLESSPLTRTSVFHQARPHEPLEDDKSKTRAVHGLITVGEGGEIKGLIGESGGKMLTKVEGESGQEVQLPK
jgi:hypothetical protein